MTIFYVEHFHLRRNWTSQFSSSMFRQCHWFRFKPYSLFN